MVGRLAEIFGRQSSIGGVTAGSVSARNTGSTISTPAGACGLTLTRPDDLDRGLLGQLVDLREGRLVLDDDLGQPGPVADDHEGQPGQPPASVDPAGDADGGARLVGVRRELRRQGAGDAGRDADEGSGDQSWRPPESVALEMWATGKFAVPPHLRRSGVTSLRCTACAVAARECLRRRVAVRLHSCRRLSGLRCPTTTRLRRCRAIYQPRRIRPR